MFAHVCICKRERVFVICNRMAKNRGEKQKVMDIPQIKRTIFGVVDVGLLLGAILNLVVPRRRACRCVSHETSHSQGVASKRKSD